MSKHTRGSWWHGGAGCCVKRPETEDDHGEILPERHIACTCSRWWGEDANGWKPDIYSREDEANAARIAACVNALDGIEDPEAFVEAAKHITRELTDGILAHGLSSAQEDALRMADGMIARVFVEVCGGVRQDSPHCPSNILRRHFPGVLAALGGER